MCVCGKTDEDGGVRGLGGVAKKILIERRNAPPEDPRPFAPRPKAVCEDFDPPKAAAINSWRKRDQQDARFHFICGLEFCIVAHLANNSPNDANQTNTDCDWGLWLGSLRDVDRLGGVCVFSLESCVGAPWMSRCGKPLTGSVSKQPGQVPSVGNAATTAVLSKPDGVDLQQE